MAVYDGELGVRELFGRVGFWGGEKGWRDRERLFIIAGSRTLVFRRVRASICNIDRVLGFLLVFYLYYLIFL